MKRHHTKTKGDLGLLKAQLDLVRKGFQLFLPFSEHNDIDLVAYKEEKFIRIQVKYRKKVSGKICIPFKTNWSDKNGIHSKPYDKNNIDIFCIYCPDTDKCYYIKPKDFKTNVTLRIDKPKYKFKSLCRVHLADNYLSL